MLVYVPAAVLAVQEIFTRKATFSINDLRIHLTGAGAVLFGLGQLASAAMAIVGILLAIQNSNIFYIFGGTIFGTIAALIGLWAARKTQAGEVEFVNPVPMNMEIRIDEENGFVFRQGMDKEQFNPEDVIVIEDEDGNTEPKAPKAPPDDNIMEGEYTEIDDDNDNKT